MGVSKTIDFLGNLRRLAEANGASFFPLNGRVVPPSIVLHSLMVASLKQGLPGLGNRAKVGQRTLTLIFVTTAKIVVPFI